MLQVQTLPASLAVLLAALRPCFTTPSFATFTALVAGMIAQPGRRTVTGMWSGAGLAGVCHHARAHWFFARARWNADAVGLAVAALIVARLLPADAAVLIAVDDSIFRRTGRRVGRPVAAIVQQKEPRATGSAGQLLGHRRDW